MTEPDYTRLLIDLQAGHAAAFEQVFKLLYKPLRMQAFLILKNEEEAEDQVQQLFFDLWNKQLYRNVQQSLKAYLHTAIRNRCFNYLTRANQKNKIWNEYAGHFDVTIAAGDKEQVLMPYLLQVLKELPVQRYTAFNLVHMEDKKYHEAAREMGISINSLKSHLKLAVKFLRIRLKDYYGSPV